MKRVYRFALLAVLVASTLACGLITNPINEARGNVETVQALASAIPIETLQALPSTIPNMEGIASVMPTFEGIFNPTGEPVDVWKDIPIMPQATSGSETVDMIYSFTAPVSLEEVQTFYTSELEALGWSQQMSLPGSDQAVILLFQKDDQFLSITATAATQGNEVVVMLTLQ